VPYLLILDMQTFVSYYMLQFQIDFGDLCSEDIGFDWMA